MSCFLLLQVKSRYTAIATNNSLHSELPARPCSSNLLSSLHPAISITYILHFPYFDSVLYTIMIVGSATIRADRAYSCPGMEVVFTCVVNTTVLSWDIYFLSGDNINRVEFSPSDSIGRHRQLSPRTSQGTVYTFNLASKSPLTSIMTTIASTDLSGATISCQDGISGSFHIDTLVVEILPGNLL